MTTAIAPGRVADRVKARASGYDPARVLLLLVMALPFAFGWAAAKVCRILWVAGTVLFAAAAEGWSSGWAAESRRR